MPPDSRVNDPRRVKPFALLIDSGPSTHPTSGTIRFRSGTIRNHPFQVRNHPEPSFQVRNHPEPFFRSGTIPFVRKDQRQIVAGEYSLW